MSTNPVFNIESENSYAAPSPLRFRYILFKSFSFTIHAIWASAMAMLTQCYSIRGLNVVASLNISNTINNVFNIVFIALGDSVAIIVGQLLGA